MAQSKKLASNRWLINPPLKNTEMKARAIIERGNDGSYDITLEYNENLTFGVLGQGKTIPEAKADFENSIKEMLEYYDDIGKEFPDLEIEYAYDTVSFLQSLSTIFSMAGLSKITGINRKQLGHYVQGISKPRPETAQRIQNSIISYAESISSVKFV